MGQQINAARVQSAVEIECLRIIGERLATPELVDALLRRAGFGVGPLERLEREGAGHARVRILQELELAYGDPRYRPPALLDEVVAAEQQRLPARQFLNERFHLPAQLPIETSPGQSFPLEPLLVDGTGPLREQTLEAASRAGLSLTDSWPEAASVLLPLAGFIEVSRLAIRNALQKATSARLILSHCAPWTVTEITSTLRDTARVVGFDLHTDAAGRHFCEIAAGLNSDPRAINLAAALFGRLSWESTVTGDGPGMVVNRVLAVLANEAMLQSEELAQPHRSVDVAIASHSGYGFAPLAWAEHVGLNSVLLTIRTLQADYGDDRYRPAITLRRCVQAGWQSLDAGSDSSQAPR